MSGSAGADGLMAGAGEADITPAKGIQISGDIGRWRPVEEVRDPLKARALVLRMGGETACFVSADVTGMMRRKSDPLRQRIADLLGTEPGAVIAHAMQSHSAPSVGHHTVSDDCPIVPADLPWLRGGDERYVGPFFDGVMEAVGKAAGALRPARLRAARLMDGRIAFNRRFVMRDGTTATHAGTCDPNILHREGLADPEVGVAVFEDESGGAIAALLHHTCHPCHGYPHRWISADWPGAWAEGARGLLGASCVPLVVNGACGNIHHADHVNPAQEDTIEAMTRLLMETTARIVPRLAPVEVDRLRRIDRKVRMPLREIPRREVEAARRFIDEHPEPVWLDAERTRASWDWVYSAATLDLEETRKRSPDYDCEIQVVRVGGLALVGWPGEPFVEAQLAVKKRSPAAHTFVAHMCNDMAGYIPTERAFEGGGYETRTANWSKLEPEALETLQAETRAMLKELF